MRRTLRLGTRASPLALWQAHHVRDALLGHHPGLEVEIVEVTTEADRRTDVPLAHLGGKGLWLVELERELLDGSIDLAVHSMKDVTVSLPDGLHIPVVCERGDPLDALVSPRYDGMQSLPSRARIGSCSLRRRCLLGAALDAPRMLDLRGNVGTRLARLDRGDFDAVVLAAAGLARLGLEHRITERIDPDLCLPAVGQGAVGIEIRAGDSTTGDLVAALDDPATHACVRAERRVNERLEGGCHAPIAAYAEWYGESLRLRAMVGMPDGTSILRAEATGRATDPEGLGERVAADLADQGAAEILRRAAAIDIATRA